MFRLTSSGDVNGLVRLFEEGKVSVTNCNPEGVPLLSVSTPRRQRVSRSVHLISTKYAYLGCQSIVCNYFWEKGADLDCFTAMLLLIRFLGSVAHYYVTVYC